MTDTLDAKQWALDHSPDALKGRKIAVAYGGGSNSTALLLRFHELGIVPNLILFADTGGERPDVYKGIEQLNAWLPTVGMPEIIRDVAHRGHTVGTHTWSHADIRKKPDQEGKDEIEKGISGVKRAVGGPVAPFFRYPYLRDSQASIAHLASRAQDPLLDAAATIMRGELATRAPSR